MALTRERLEKFEWAVGTDGESVWVEEFGPGHDTTLYRDARVLQSEAPRLALACLEAREFIASITNLEDEPGDVALLARLDAALSAADVEIPGSSTPVEPPAAPDRRRELARARYATRKAAGTLRKKILAPPVERAYEPATECHCSTCQRPPCGFCEGGGR